MDIISTRKIRQLRATISECTINSHTFCHILEDKDRGLKSDMPLDEILKLKVPKETAIPTGKYEVVMAWSPHYQCDMPHLVNVPGYSGVMIHWGNSDVDTEGCLLMGEYKVGDNDWINNSHKLYLL